MSDIKWLMARQIPYLRRYAFALTGNRDDADDVVQECLERAIRKQHLWSNKGSLKAWLFRILYRTYIDTKRRRVPSNIAGNISPEDAELVQPPDQQVALECKDIANALRRLPDDQRAVVLLVALEGLSYDEVAAILDIPIGTVRSRLSRARTELRKTEAPAEPPVRLRRVK